MDGPHIFALKPDASSNIFMSWSESFFFVPSINEEINAFGSDEVSTVLFFDVAIAVKLPVLPRAGAPRHVPPEYTYLSTDHKTNDGLQEKRPGWR